MDVDSEVVLAVASQMKCCLARKLLAPQPIVCDILRRTLSMAWRIESGLSLEKLGKNLFLFSFDRVQDQIRVFRTGPWFFDKFLLVLERLDAMVKPSKMRFHKVAFWMHFFYLPLACMNPSMARRLGNVVGEFEFVDCNSEGQCWGSSLRVRVRIDISMPLQRGVKINIEGPIAGCWIPMQYEKLPQFCAHCGMFDHGSNECARVLDPAGESSVKRCQLASF